ncbi:hypothetical protein MKQ70_15010 [Chitinophaga sedimenti]|uniref:hypothetical protein n=1 Tax=Chitinophaga sedimenti TaxID=2033606 RepID=UPI0020068C33|nr:hypothetical protein [Chitinophaga sedimenti]MCK7556254.1 hypothetical protein [Chitinophaga sedimenti]
MLLAYLPACWEANLDKGEPDRTELSFRLRVFPTKQTGTGINDNAASFGTDSLFRLVVGGDSLMPRYTERIANGNISGVEYLVVFDRSALKQATSAVVVFHDWLFTHSQVEFPYITENIQKTDELSCSL